MRKIITLLAALASTSALAIATALPAAATGPGPWNLSEASGNYWVGASDLNSGTAVWEADGPRDMYWAPNGSTYNGDSTGDWGFSNGYAMRTSDDCSHVYITSNAYANGIIWALHFANGHVYIINRRCDQLIGSGNGGLNGVALAGKNVEHRGMFVSQPATGVYRAFDLDPG